MAPFLHFLILPLFLGLSTYAHAFYGSPSNVVELTAPSISGSFEFEQRAMQQPTHYQGNLSRRMFPSHFVWGSSSSAYQVEGGVDERGTCTWDTECKIPGRILDGSTGNEDVDILKNIGFNAYRFSISWARIYPEGVGVKPNQAGVDYYNNLIDELLREGIQPWVTLYHFDLPQALADKYDGWISRQIISDYSAYAETCFRLFGDRVTRWITVNEPTIDLALNPGFRGPPEDNTPQRRYKQAHNMLLAHAAAVKVYREKYIFSTIFLVQGMLTESFEDLPREGGMIGLSLDIQWYEPLTSSTEDAEAADTAMKFRCGWLLDPLVYGRYPKEIRAVWGKDLPDFTAEESKLLNGALDFLGVNYYSGYYASSKPALTLSNEPVMPVVMPPTIYIGEFKNGVAIGERTASGLRVYPLGLEKVLLMLTSKYKNIPSVITENGISESRQANRSLESYLQDEKRIEFYRQHLGAVHSAYKKGADVRGFFAWSIMDNFEWLTGYLFMLGLSYVDFDNNQARHLKESAYWFRQFLTEA